MLLAFVLFLSKGVVGYNCNQPGHPEYYNGTTWQGQQGNPDSNCENTNVPGDDDGVQCQQQWSCMWSNITTPKDIQCEWNHACVSALLWAGGQIQCGAPGQDALSHPFACQSARQVSAGGMVQCMGPQGCLEAEVIQSRGSNVQCSNEQACQYAGMIEAKQNVQCSNEQACQYAGMIDAKQNVTCTQNEACANTTMIKAGMDVMCTQQSSCAFSEQINAGRDVLCEGEKSCANAMHVMAGKNITASGYLSAQEATLEAQNVTCSGQSSCLRSTVSATWAECLGEKSCMNATLLLKHMLACDSASACFGIEKVMQADTRNGSAGFLGYQCYEQSGCGEILVMCQGLAPIMKMLMYTGYTQTEMLCMAYSAPHGKSTPKLALALAGALAGCVFGIAATYFAMRRCKKADSDSKDEPLLPKFSTQKLKAVKSRVDTPSPPGSPKARPGGTTIVENAFRSQRTLKRNLKMKPVDRRPGTPSPPGSPKARPGGTTIVENALRNQRTLDLNLSTKNRRT